MSNLVLKKIVDISEPLAKVVIPVKTGIQRVCITLKRLDSHFRGNDIFPFFKTFAKGSSGSAADINCININKEWIKDIGVCRKSDIKDDLRKAIDSTGSLRICFTQEEAKKVFGYAAVNGSYNIKLTADGDIFAYEEGNPAHLYSIDCNLILEKGGVDETNMETLKEYVHSHGFKNIAEKISLYMDYERTYLNNRCIGMNLSIEGKIIASDIGR